MYRVHLDYERVEPIGPHWYGQRPGGTQLPPVPGSPHSFYPVLTFTLGSLSPDVFGGATLDVPCGQIVLPHYFASNFTIEDLFFEFGDDGRVVRLRDAASFESAQIPVYADDIDLRPCALTLHRLPRTQDPASEDFDPDQLEWPHHQLGGVPYLVQPFDEPLVCPECGTRMCFFAQIANDRRLHVTFEDSGVAYYWWCDPCRILGCHVAGA
ncbi:MAG: hypothetical protein R3F62_26800 [Planctomycetota bacterium]